MLLCVLTACASITAPENTPVSEVETTIDNVKESANTTPFISVDNRTVMAPTNFLETEKMYLGKSSFSDYLWYWDKLTQESGFLCSKPECLHKTPQCDAWVGDIEFGCLSLSGDSIYWIGFGAPQSSGRRIYGIWCMSIESGKRHLIRELDYNDTVKYDFQYSYLYGDCYYRIGTTEVIENGMPYQLITLVETPLSGEESLVVFQKNLSIGASGDASLRFVDNNVFLLWRQQTDEKNTSGIVSWDIVKKKLTEYWQGDTPAGFNQLLVITSEEILLTTSSISANADVYRVTNDGLNLYKKMTEAIQGYTSLRFQNDIILLRKVSEDFSQEKQIYKYDVKVEDVDGLVLAQKTVSIDPMTLPRNGAGLFLALTAVFCDANYLYFDTQLIDRSTPNGNIASFLFRFDLSENVPSGQILNDCLFEN